MKVTFALAPQRAFGMHVCLHARLNCGEIRMNCYLRGAIKDEYSRYKNSSPQFQ